MISCNRETKLIQVSGKIACPLRVYKLGKLYFTFITIQIVGVYII